MRLSSHIKKKNCGVRQPGPRGWVKWWPPLDSPGRIGLIALWLLLHLFIFAFYFHRRCEWSVALGITDMTRDTLLLEFSQVRATPIEEPRVPLFAKPRKEERERKASRSFSLFFVVLSTYPKKRWTQKSLIKRIWRWAGETERERASERERALFLSRRVREGLSRRVLLNGWRRAASLGS